MIPQLLNPQLELLREEYVLVQAWKKTASYIRYHNWYADTLALDRAAVNLRAFIGELRERLQSPENWQNDPLRIVPAPKSQRWRVRKGIWGPENDGNSVRLRPLAHVNLADQVMATALILCLADRVETIQGDPRQSIRDQNSPRRVISYGNRLFCDEIDNKLRHRWGSAKLYRAYFQDYRSFLSRPEIAAKPIDGRILHVVHADLQQFYDRVRPCLLSSAIALVRDDGDDPSFYSLAESLLNWCWHPSDETDVQLYAKQANLEDFTRVALPQGLVAAGFFANIVLLQFDEALRKAIRTEISSGITLLDGCRYVDDLRILIEIDPESNPPLKDIKATVSEWLCRVLDNEAPGLTLSPEKTQIAAIGGDERPLVRQSKRMDRIQSAVSGGFDAAGGEEILDAIQGLMRGQEALSAGDSSGWQLSPVPDVRDETIARFGAARFRTTFRSIRPLLDDGQQHESERQFDKMRPRKNFLVTRTRRELDDEVRAFALGLIERWIVDPSNVRLLRIGLDLWPDTELLREVLLKLRPFTVDTDCEIATRLVAWYCLAEILRAGATETGFVVDGDSLPSKVNLESYRKELCSEATRLLTLPERMIPWYIQQQALLFLATCDPSRAPLANIGTDSETQHYQDLIQFLRGEGDRLQSSEFATLAVLARRAFVGKNRSVELTRSGLNRNRKRQIAEKDPSFFLELAGTGTGGPFFKDLSVRTREDLCQFIDTSDKGIKTSLAKLILTTHPRGSIRNELSLLYFARAFLEQWAKQQNPLEVISPGQVTLTLREDRGVAFVKNLGLRKGKAREAGSLYGVPAWCRTGEQWRFQLGYLLRFILSGQPDFTRPVREPNWREDESCYHPVVSHWFQRLYGLYNGQPAFGDDWLPISDWIEGLLLALLRWPGCRVPEGFAWVKEEGIEEAICKRIGVLEQDRGNATGTLMMPLLAKRPKAEQTERKLRICVVQTVIPTDDQFQKSDLTLDDSAIRTRHRKHLSAALAAVKRMLYLRETHKSNEGRLDWLILPELAVHPKDVRTHLIPFARAHGAMILTGLTYEEIIVGQPLANSALWIIPEYSDAYGLQIRIRRQGKAYLAPSEQEKFNSGGTQFLQGFRPCQWLIDYPWCSNTGAPPVRLTGSVCYDATDLGLAADLRGKSDVLAIPALNKDIRTFDQMALALHYHMFQLVIVANNGQYGGSNAYWPKHKEHIKQIFHTHGQPQASISFLEIDDIDAFLNRRDVTGPNTKDWKYPPAAMI